MWAILECTQHQYLTSEKRSDLAQQRQHWAAILKLRLLFECGLCATWVQIKGGFLSSVVSNQVRLLHTTLRHFDFWMSVWNLVANENNAYTQLYVTDTVPCCTKMYRIRQSTKFFHVQKTSAITVSISLGLRIKRSSVRIRQWALRWVLGQGSLLPLSQGEAFTLASISYLAILVNIYTGKKKNLLNVTTVKGNAKNWTFLGVRATALQNHCLWSCR